MLGDMVPPAQPAPPPPAEPPAGPLPPPRTAGARYRVCLVCLGNICRSPMAEAVLRAQLDRDGLAAAVAVDSAGTGDWHLGEPMNRHARTALSGRGYDGSAHQARQFRPSWLADHDLILAMDAANLADLQRLAAPADRDRIRLFGEVGGLTEPGVLTEAGGLAGPGGLAEPPADGAIPDPYGGTDADFGHVLDLLAAAAPVITARLADLLGRSAPSA
jgi:low molecular weight protein-tyrosine phosphatase